MFFKFLSTFLAVQAVSFAIWQGVQARPHQAANETVPITPHTSIHSSADHVRYVGRDSQGRGASVSSAEKSQIATVLQKLPQSHVDSLKNIVLDYNPNAHRGLGGKSLVILRATNIDTNEFFSVMIHEIGHNVDLGSMQAENTYFTSEFKDGRTPIYESDLSLDFYRISWENDKKRKNSMSNADFVSGYAMTDPFEDFAETYVYYVLHNKEFQSKVQTSDVLLEKYYFMKNMVFDGQEFDTGQYTTRGLNTRPWDITKLDYQMNQFLNS